MAKRSKTASTGVRITGGRWRSRRLQVAEVAGLRPTSDRSRETLFNWLGHNLSGLQVADLFAGSGVLGFEALSRGAASCEFVENHPKAVAGLSLSATAFGLEQPAFVIRQMAVSNWQMGQNGPFDLVFVDPPFTQGGWSGLLQDLLPCLAKKARVYVEAPDGVSWSWPPGYRLLKQSRVGEASLRLFGWAGQG